ncbi:hypothetical protein [Crocinitomix catalasitica]|uniref:hypothetical protein n=1 Tax=Crocinitomix catalasitica TaxID=184607 RepID=UPI00047FB3AF|nr:hypothetical protein [Crocinitomix catalasitica]
MKLIYLCLIFAFYACNQSDTSKINELENLDSLITNTDTLNKAVIVEDSIIINNYWSEQNIASATLYCYYPEADRRVKNLILDKDFKLNATVIDSLTYELPQSTFDDFKKNLLNQTNFMEELVSGCFDPHHGLVLKNDEEEIVGHFSICFDCNHYRLIPEHVSYIPMDVFRKLCHQADIPIAQHVIGKRYQESIKK